MQVLHTKRMAFLPCLLHGYGMDLMMVDVVICEGDDAQQNMGIFYCRFGI